MRNGSSCGTSSRTSALGHTIHTHATHMAKPPEALAPDSHWHWHWHFHSHSARHTRRYTLRASPVVLLLGRTPVDALVHVAPCLLSCGRFARRGCTWSRQCTRSRQGPAPRARVARSGGQPARRHWPSWTMLADVAGFRYGQGQGPSVAEDDTSGSRDPNSLTDSLCGVESVRDGLVKKSSRDGSVRSVSLARFLLEVAGPDGSGWTGVEKIMAKKLEEATAALLDFRWSRSPRHQLHLDDERKVRTCCAGKKRSSQAGRGRSNTVVTCGLQGHGAVCRAHANSSKHD